MKTDACDYGDGAALAGKGSRRPPAAVGEADAEDADAATPGQALEDTPAAANGHGRFGHLQEPNGVSTAGTTMPGISEFSTACCRAGLPAAAHQAATNNWLHIALAPYPVLEQCSAAGQQCIMIGMSLQVGWCCDIRPSNMCRHRTKQE